MLMTPVVFSPGARSRVPDSACIDRKAQIPCLDFEGREGLGADLVIPETHERDRLLGRQRSSTHPGVVTRNGAVGLVRDRIANVYPVLRAIDLFKTDLDAVGWQRLSESCAMSSTPIIACARTSDAILRISASDGSAAACALVCGLGAGSVRTRTSIAASWPAGSSS